MYLGEPCWVSWVIAVSPSMDRMTVQELVKQLKDTVIYRLPQSFCRVSSCSSCFLAEYVLKLQCWDTYWVVSCNYQLLCYISKRIHFSTRVFTMRLNLAVMDWVSQSLQSSCMYTIFTHRMRMWVALLLAPTSWWTYGAQTGGHQWKCWWTKHTPLLVLSWMPVFAEITWTWSKYAKNTVVMYYRKFKFNRPLMTMRRWLEMIWTSWKRSNLYQTQRVMTAMMSKLRK